MLLKGGGNMSKLFDDRMVTDVRLIETVITYNDIGQLPPNFSSMSEKELLASNAGKYITVITHKYHCLDTTGKIIGIKQASMTIGTRESIMTKEAEENLFSDAHNESKALIVSAREDFTGIQTVTI